MTDEIFFFKLYNTLEWVWKNPRPIILKSWPDYMYLYPCLSSCFKVQYLIEGDLMHHIYFIGQYSIVYTYCCDGILER